MSNRTLFNTTLADVWKQEADGQVSVAKQTDRRSEMGDEADARAKNDLLINSAGVSIVFNLTPSEIQELSENRERPDEECYFPEAVGCSEGIGNVYSLTDLMVWHRCRVDYAIDYASTSLDMIDGYFDDMIGELANTWRGRRNLFAKVLGVDLKNGDTEVDAEFVKNTFDLSDAAIQEQIEYSRENPDEPYLFPLPTNCSEGSGAQFFSLAKLLCWHKHRVETVVNKAKIALREARATIVPVMNELHSTWIGRKAILEKLLDVDIDLSNMYDYHHEEDE